MQTIHYLQYGIDKSQEAYFHQNRTNTNNQHSYLTIYTGAAHVSGCGEITALTRSGGTVQNGSEAIRDPRAYHPEVKLLLDTGLLCINSCADKSCARVPGC